MNAELIEAISDLSKAVEGLQPGNSSSATTMEADDTSVLPVHLYMLLDRSGSMSGWEQDVIGGFNTFIKEQQKEKDDCSVTLVQFDGQAPYEVIIDAQDLGTVTELAPNVYRPRGNTPLLDALGRMIKNAEKSEAKQAEDVLVWVFTDGLENASREFTYEQLSLIHI